MSVPSFPVNLYSTHFQGLMQDKTFARHSFIGGHVDANSYAHKLD